MKPPIPAQQHGKDVVTVTLGTGESTKSFRVHKDLLCAASDYFDNAFQKPFKEQRDGEVKLSDQDPFAFSTLYHYIYSGEVLSADFYTENCVPEDVHWLRTLKLADYTGIHALVVAVYERLRSLFSIDRSTTPTANFIADLYDDTPQVNVQRYVVAHTVYWIENDSSVDWKKWKQLLEIKPGFAVDVAIHFAKINSSVYQAHKSHPQQDPALFADNLYPEPKSKEVKRDTSTDTESEE